MGESIPSPSFQGRRLGERATPDIHGYLMRAIASTPIIDNHAHPLLRPAALSTRPLLAIATEAHGDAIDDSKTSLAHFRAVRYLSGLIDCDPSWDAVAPLLRQKHQAGGDAYDKWVARCMHGIQSVLVDDGLDDDSDAETYRYFDRCTAGPSRRIVRLEKVAAEIIEEACKTCESATDAWRATLAAFDLQMDGALSDPVVVGFKSVICYRTGLALPRKVDVDGTHEAFRAIHEQRRRSGAAAFSRLDVSPLNEYFVHLAASHIQAAALEHRKPIQFHTGLGDNDITLTTASPSHLQGFVREYPAVPIVLLHTGWPFVREASYLAAMYANVYADVGEVFPFLSFDGQAACLRQMLELCPTSKIMWSTDGHWFPETYLLAVQQMRAVFADVLEDYARRGMLTLEQATTLVDDVLFNNANRVYDLGLTMQRVPIQVGEGNTESSMTLDGLHSRKAAATRQSAAFREDSDTAMLQVLDKFNARFLRICWSDMTAMVRMRAVPTRQVKASLASAHSLSLGVTKASLGLLQNDVAVPGLSPSGEYRLVPHTARVRPGPRKGHAMIMGEFREADGTLSPLCPRTLLRTTLEQAASRGLRFTLGFEVELVLLRRGPNGFDALDSDGHAWSVSGAMNHDGAMSVIEEAVAQLHDGGVYVEMVHPEAAPGQYEVVLPRAPALDAVDALVYAREVLSACATAKGYRMTLHPKPYAGACGTAAHMHMSMSPLSAQSKGESNADDDDDVDEATWQGFYGGLLRHLRGVCAFTYSSAVSYERVQDGCWAGGTWVAWGTQNRETPLRKVSGSHWEVKCIDGLANPYLAVAAVMAGGLLGVPTPGQAAPNSDSNSDSDSVQQQQQQHGRTSSGLRQWGDCSADPATLSEQQRAALGVREKLPASIGQALQALQADRVLCRALGEELVSRYAAVKAAETEMLQDMGEEQRWRWIVERY